MIHLSGWMHLRALTFTRVHKPFLSVQTKFSLLTVSDPWIKENNTYMNIHTSLPPAVFQSPGEFGKILPKSACWAGDYNTALPTVNQKAAKSCLGLHPPSQYSSLFPSAFSPGLFLNPLPALPSSNSRHHFSTCPPLLFCTSFITYIFDTRPLSLCFFCTHRSTAQLSRSTERRNTRKTVGEGTMRWRGGNVTTEAWGGLFRQPRWQGSPGRTGEKDHIKEKEIMI